MMDIYFFFLGKRWGQVHGLRTGYRKATIGSGKLTRGGWTDSVKRISLISSFLRSSPL